MKNRKVFILLYSTYSFISNIFNIIINIMPFFVRYIVFKCLFSSFGSNIYIDYNCYFRYYSKITIGNDVTINRGCRFFGSHHNKDAIIRIGNNVAIAPDVSFFSASHDYTQLNLPDTAKSIIIKDNVWIGGRSIILPGVTIGEGCVIGAGSVVSSNIPDWSVAVGNPAKVIKQRKIPTH